jgi:hypothetical protein
VSAAPSSTAPRSPDCPDEMELHLADLNSPFNACSYRAACLKTARELLRERGTNSAIAPRKGRLPRHEVFAWAKRHDIRGQETDLRAMLDDARSLEAVDGPTDGGGAK